MEPDSAIWILLVGATILLSALVNSIAHHARVPTIVGYVLLGSLLHAADERWALLGDGGHHAFGLLADLGLVALLFHVGLKSHLRRLLDKLEPAALIWFGNVALSGAAGYIVARHWAGLSLGASLTIGTALTATSIGVAAAAWSARDALDTPDGALMLDVAELDDVSAVLFMAALFALLPALAEQQGVIEAVAVTGGVFLLKFAGFGALCYLFARYAEAPLTRFASLERAPERMLTVAGAAFMIAAIAGWLGFSLAIGALFAGLLFSRDPEAVRTEARFGDIHDFLAPFFFVGIGLEADFTTLGGAWGLAGMLLVVAVASKVVGAALPALFVTSLRGALLIGVSMIPRAEIALVVGYQGLLLGVLSQSQYTAILFVSLATCVLSPWLVGTLLRETSRPGATTPPPALAHRSLPRSRSRARSPD